MLFDVVSGRNARMRTVLCKCARAPNRRHHLRFCSAILVIIVVIWLSSLCFQWWMIITANFNDHQPDYDYDSNPCHHSSSSYRLKSKWSMKRTLKIHLQHPKHSKDCPLLLHHFFSLLLFLFNFYSFFFPSFFLALGGILRPRLNQIRKRPNCSWLKIGSCLWDWTLHNQHATLFLLSFSPSLHLHIYIYL